MNVLTEPDTENSYEYVKQSSMDNFRSPGVERQSVYFTFQILPTII